MGVLHSSFLPEHHDTHGKIYFLRKMIIDIDGGKSGDSCKVIPKRSRHDCHFPPGSTTVPLGKNKSMLATSNLFVSSSTRYYSTF